MGVTRVLGPNRIKPWLPDQSKLTSQSSGPTSITASAPRMLAPLTSLEDKVVLAGRSVYYGALLYAGYLSGGLWLTVVIQALSVAYVLQLLMVRLWGLSELKALGVIAALSFLSPLAAYTGFLMPDIFAPLVILSVGALAVYWQQLQRRDRWILSALLLFGLSAHASHLALALSMLVLLLSARLIATRWHRLSLIGLTVVAGCMVGALAAEWAFNKAVTAAVGAPPLRLPHPMARLIDLGPGTQYLKQRCPAVGYAACAYVQNYPTEWEDFLFSTDPAKGSFALADVATKRRMSSEQIGFFVDVLRYDPVGVIGGIGADVLRQLAKFQVDIWGYGENNVTKYYAGRVPDSVFTDLQASRAAHSSPFNVWLTIATYVSVIASIGMIALWGWRQTRAGGTLPMNPAERQLADFVWIAIAGVVANAVVCASLASSLDRFQARVIWLVPFFAMALLAVSRARHLSPSAAEVAAASFSAAPPPDSPPFKEIPL